MEPEKTPRSGDALGVVRYYWMQAKNVLIHPKQFFAELPRDGGYVEPLIFLGITAAIYSVLQALGNLNPGIFFSAFFGSVIKTLVGAGVANFIITRMMGGKGNREGTFRVFSYSKATLLFAWIKVGALPLGGFLSLFYAIYLNTVGCAQVHEVSKVKLAALFTLMSIVGFLVTLKTGF